MCCGQHVTSPLVCVSHAWVVSAVLECGEGVDRRGLGGEVLHPTWYGCPPCIHGQTPAQLRSFCPRPTPSSKYSTVLIGLCVRLFAPVSSTAMHTQSSYAPAYQPAAYPPA